MKDGERILSEGREGGDQEFSVGHITFRCFVRDAPRHQRLVDLCVDEVAGT